ncbi:hypothetical protein MPH_09407 [Macrophomina phaseolina MS6]|uniref:Uncharacterized protein n=1 Tax=Macrophomina phaseolina (strain MS6) TaxID=1126212 RepID=K2QUE0_MACPH|nr:hypothetical protein MPH_09407 [Macrophomina phaseolina MS6]
MSGSLLMLTRASLPSQRACQIRQSTMEEMKQRQTCWTRGSEWLKVISGSPAWMRLETTTCWVRGHRIECLLRDENGWRMLRRDAPRPKRSSRRASSRRVRLRASGHSHASWCACGCQHVLRRECIRWAHDVLLAVENRREGLSAIGGDGGQALEFWKCEE